MCPHCLAQDYVLLNGVLIWVHLEYFSFHLEHEKSIYLDSCCSNKTINVMVVGIDHTSPVTFHQLLHTFTEPVANPEFIPHKAFCVGLKSHIKPCAPISILAAGMNLSCYCQL